MTTALTASYRHPYQYQFHSQQDNKTREEKRTEREQRERPTPPIRQNVQLEDLEALLKELVALRKARQQKSARDESLSEEYQKKKLLLNVKLFAIQSSGEMTGKANRELLQQLAQQRDQLLADEQQQTTDLQASGPHDALTAAMKKAGVTLTTQAMSLTRVDAALQASKTHLKVAVPIAPQGNEMPQPRLTTKTSEAASMLVSAPLQQTDFAPTDEKLDVATLQQLANDVILLADEVSELWQSVVDEARDVVMTVLLQNPTALKRADNLTTPPENPEQPELPLPRRDSTYDLERMMLSLRSIKIDTATLKIETEKYGSDAMQAVMLQTAKKRLRDNAELQDKVRQQQKSAERRGTLFKWLTRIVMTLVGVLVSALTAGAGAVLFSLLFTLVEVALEEAAGFSLTGKIAEGIGKGLAAVMKVMGACGEWVEHVANALAQIIVLVASILVSKGISKFSTSNLGKRLAGFITDKMPCLKKLPGVPDASKLAKPLQWVQRHSSLVQGTAGVATHSMQLVQFAYMFERVKTMRQLGDSNAEIKQVEFWQDLLYQMMKNLPKGLDQSTKSAKEFIELASELINGTYQRNKTLTMNIAAR